MSSRSFSSILSSSALAALLDKMLENDLEDMDIEIDVFERMLKSDGLNADELTDTLRQSAQAAAREIPMSGAPAYTTATTASARQMQQGTPVLDVPDMPTAPDLTDASRRHSQP